MIAPLLAVAATAAETASVPMSPATHLAITGGLLVLAAVLLILEIFLVSGGALGIGALISTGFAIHHAFLFDATTGWLILIASPFVAIAVMRYGLRRLQTSSLVPSSEISGHSSYSGHAEAAGVTVGSIGELLTRAMPGGRARFAGGTFDVSMLSGSGEQGESVRVVEIRGPRVLVRRHEDSAAETETSSSGLP